MILVPFISAMRPRVICKGTSEEYVKQKKDDVGLCDANRSAESEFNGCVQRFFDVF